MENPIEEKFFCYGCSVRLVAWYPEKYLSTMRGGYGSCERCYASDSGEFLLIDERAEKLSDKIDRAMEGE